MKIHLRLNEDHLKLISFIKIEDEKDDVLEINKVTILSLQSHLLDDVAMILGLRDQAIEGTSESELGCAYPEEVEKRMLDAYTYVRSNLYYIETLLHQRCNKGIHPGHYVAIDNEMIWEEAED